MDNDSTQTRLIAKKIWSLSRDRVLVNLRFLNTAVMAIKPVERQGIKTIQCDIGIDSDGSCSATVYYDALDVISSYKKNRGSITRTLLHILMHCVFSHFFQYGKKEKELWDVAVDMAVEGVVLSLELQGLSEELDIERRAELEKWQGKAGALTAQRLYRCFVKDGIGEDELAHLGRLFCRDEHISRGVDTDERFEIGAEQWKKLSERIKAELNSFSQNKAENGAMLQNIEEATREKYDYGDFLRRFCVSGEDMRVNDDEFDYVYYTYGLSLYGNMPLVEPLEYRDVKKIREFVIAIDTSGSCRGRLVQSFLDKTYAILKNQESFFNKVNIHIIQCDSRVRKDTKITNDEEFEMFMKEGTLAG